MAQNHLSYYDVDEIESAVLDLLDENMIEDAEQLSEHGMRLHPNDDTVEKLAIWIYLHHHKAEKAEAMFQKYKEENSPWSIRMHFALDVMHGHPQRALEEFFTALKKKQITSLEWSTTIDEMYEALPLMVLSPYLINAIEIIDDNAESLGRIGTFLIESHRFDKAIVALEKALDIDAYDIFSWQDLARAYMLTDNTEKCLEACDFGLAIDETNPLLSFLKGYTYYQKGDTKQCIEPLQVARKFAEGKIEARNINIPNEDLQDQINFTYEMLATAYTENGQTKEAKECYEILAERKPDNIIPHVQLASISLLDGDLNKAYSHIEKALEIDSKAETVLSLQISVLTSMHKFEEALSVLKKLTQVKPKNRNFLIAYAELAIHLGKNKEADKTYRKLLKMGKLEQSHMQLLKNYFIRIGDDEALQKIKEDTNNNEE